MRWRQVRGEDALEASSERRRRLRRRRRVRCLIVVCVSCYESRNE